MIVGRVDAATQPSLIIKYRISKYPTMLLFRYGEESEQYLQDLNGPTMVIYMDKFAAATATGAFDMTVFVRHVVTKRA